MGSRPSRLFKSLLLLSLLGSLQAASGPPRILGSLKKKYTVNVGDTVKMKCRATGANDALALRTLFYWKKLDSDQVIRSSKDFPRFKVKQGKYLKIKNVQLEDSGRYICAATNAHGFVVAYRTLTVKDTGKRIVKRKKRVRPTKIPLSVSMPAIVKGGESAPYFINAVTNNSKARQLKHPIGHIARLKCAIDGKPKPAINWSKNGLPITKKHGVRFGQADTILVLKSLRKQDSGNYTCTATNKFGTLEMKFSLTVASFARFRDPQVTNRIRNVTAVVGKNLTLTCRTDVKGRRGGLPHLHWIKWNSDSNPDSETMFTAPRERTAIERKSKTGMGDRSRWDYSSNGNGSLIGKLTLINVSAVDGGQYSCMAGVGRRWNTIDEVYVVIVKAVPVPKSGGSKTRINYEIPILILVLVPTAAGIVCIIVAFCCWRFNRKKRHKELPERYPLQDKPLQNGSVKHNGFHRSSDLLRTRAEIREETPFMNGLSLHPRPVSNHNGVNSCKKTNGVVHKPCKIKTLHEDSIDKHAKVSPKKCPSKMTCKCRSSDTLALTVKTAPSVSAEDARTL